MDISLVLAVQILQSWAYGHEVNLLSAGASTSETTGSGIYAGRLGALQQFMAVAPTTRILIAELPKDPASSGNLIANADENIVWKDVQDLWVENLRPYHIIALNFEENHNQAGRFCNDTICCEYNVTARDTGMVDKSKVYFAWNFNISDQILIKFSYYRNAIRM